MKNVAKVNLSDVLINERITENEVYFIRNTKKNRKIRRIR